jgi:hypothetical protein
MFSGSINQTRAFLGGRDSWSVTSASSRSLTSPAGSGEKMSEAEGYAVVMDDFFAEELAGSRQHGGTNDMVMSTVVQICSGLSVECTAQQ